MIKWIRTIMNKKIIFKLVAANLSLFSIHASAGITLEQQVGISAGVDYQDNPRLSRDGGNAWIYSLTPTYAISALDGRNNWYANGQVNVERSSDKIVSDDRVDPTAEIGWKREFENDAKAGISLGYRKTPLRNRQFLVTGNVQVDGDAVSRVANANFSRPLSERLNLALNAAYERNTFTYPSTTTANQVPNSFRSFNAELAYKWSEMFAPYARVGLNDYRANSQIKYQNLLGGVVVTTSPQLNFDINTGVTHFSGSQPDKWIGSFKANYSGEKYKLSGALARSASPTDRGPVDVVDSATATYTYDLSEVNHMGVGLFFAKNRSSIPSKTEQLSIFYLRDLSQYWQLDAHASGRALQDNVQGAVHGSNVGLSLIYRTSKF